MAFVQKKFVWIGEDADRKTKARVLNNILMTLVKKSSYRLEKT